MSAPRDELVSVACEAGASEACKGTHLISRRAEAKTRSRNEGQYLCLPCSRRLKFSGRRNPNVRHMTLDDGFLDVIDTEGKAYLLGWIASDGAVQRGTVAIVVHDKDRVILDTLIRIVGAALPVYRKTPEQSGFSLNSKGIVRAVCTHLRITPGKKSATVSFPDLASDALRWAFLRGFFDGDGFVAQPGLRTAPRCGIATTSRAMREAIIAFCGVPGYHNEADGQLEWNGNAALDLLSRLYDGAEFYLPRKKNLYEDWCVWVPGLSGAATHGEDALFRWIKTDPAARPPQKAHASDSGFDLTLLRAVRTHGPVTFFDTGVKIQPAYGWYFDLVPRSSITKTGYVLANSVGVIDRTYTGPVLVALLKVDPEAPDLELPARIVQIIPRPIVHIQWAEVETFDETARGEGGFGSTTEL